MALTAWLTDLDGILGPGQNYYVYLHPKTQKFLFIPWDQDQPFGQFPRGTKEQRENLSIHNPWTGQNRFLERVFKCEPFKTAYLARMSEFNKTILESERIHQQVNELAAVLRGPIQEESPERLSEFEKAVAGQTVTIVMGPGFAGGTAVTPIKPFVEARGKAVAEQLEGKSQGRTINPGFGARQLQSQRTCANTKLSCGQLLIGLPPTQMDALPAPSAIVLQLDSASRRRYSRRLVRPR